MEKPATTSLRTMQTLHGECFVSKAPPIEYCTLMHGWPSTILRLMSRTNMFVSIVVVTSENVRICLTCSKRRTMISSTLRLDTRIRMDPWRDPTGLLAMHYARCSMVQIFLPSSGLMPSIIICESTIRYRMETVKLLPLRNVPVWHYLSTTFAPLVVESLLYLLEPSDPVSWRTMHTEVCSSDSVGQARMQSTMTPIRRL